MATSYHRLCHCQQQGINNIITVVTTVLTIFIMMKVLRSIQTAAAT